MKQRADGRYCEHIYEHLEDGTKKRRMLIAATEEELQIKIDDFKAAQKRV